MKSISFKNFRRFADFPEFKFGDITILVGGNNAGKSTLQKALLLIYDNIRTLKWDTGKINLLSMGKEIPMFRFDANDIHDLSLGTFERSLFAGATEPKMQFSLCIDSFVITLTVQPSNAGADLPTAKLVVIEVNDTKRHILYTFSFNTQRMRVEFEKVAGNGDPNFDKIQTRVAELRDSLAKEDDPFEAALANQELEKLLKVRNAFIDDQKDIVESAIAEADMSDYMGLKGFNRVTGSGIPAMIENFDAYYQTIGSKTVAIIGVDEDNDNSLNQNPEENIMNGSEEDRANEQILGDKISLILESANALQNEIRKPHIYYIQAHGVSQKMFYTIDDKNDFIAQAIHEYARRGVTPGTQPDTFIKKWLKEFGIGSNYSIDSFGGAGYTVKVQTQNGWVNLADMGMGTNQLMVLLFSLATIMHEEGFHGKDGDRSYVPKFIIIEEPEQNLHPRLQSKLADLILDVTTDESYKFLVETHSEYLVRRTQVLVAEMNLDETELENQNPFKVYYFPEDGTPYDMKYLTSGRFENKFGNGFFDESAKWHLEILKKEKERK